MNGAAPAQPQQPTLRPIMHANQMQGHPSHMATQTQMPGSRGRLVHSLDDQHTGSSKKGFLVTIVVALLIIAAGSATGYLLASNNVSSLSLSSNGEMPQTSAPEGSTVVSKANEEGINDDDLFPDHAEGVLQPNDGSISNEGTHMLIREGGPDKTAFLTSSVIDLTKYEGKTVEVKGQTLASQTAGWFMDVGWIKVK